MELFTKFCLKSDNQTLLHRISHIAKTHGYMAKANLLALDVIKTGDYPVKACVLNTIDIKTESLTIVSHPSMPVVVIKDFVGCEKSTNKLGELNNIIKDVIASKITYLDGGDRTVVVKAYRDAQVDHGKHVTVKHVAENLRSGICVGKREFTIGWLTLEFRFVFGCTSLTIRNRMIDGVKMFGTAEDIKMILGIE